MQIVDDANLDVRFFSRPGATNTIAFAARWIFHHLETGDDVGKLGGKRDLVKDDPGVEEELEHLARRRCRGLRGLRAAEGHFAFHHRSRRKIAGSRERSERSHRVHFSVFFGCV